MLRAQLWCQTAGKVCTNTKHMREEIQASHGGAHDSSVRHRFTSDVLTSACASTGEPAGRRPPAPLKASRLIMP